MKVTWFRATSLEPLPAGTSKVDEVRYLDLHEGELNEAQFSRWVKQASELPGDKLGPDVLLVRKGRVLTGRLQGVPVALIVGRRMGIGHRCGSGATAACGAADAASTLDETVAPVD